MLRVLNKVVFYQILLKILYLRLGKKIIPRMELLIASVSSN